MYYSISVQTLIIIQKIARLIAKKKRHNGTNRMTDCVFY